MTPLQTPAPARASAGRAPAPPVSAVFGGRKSTKRRMAQLSKTWRKELETVSKNMSAARDKFDKAHRANIEKLDGIARQFARDDAALAKRAMRFGARRRGGNGSDDEEFEFDVLGSLDDEDYFRPVPTIDVDADAD